MQLPDPVKTDPIPAPPIPAAVARPLIQDQYERELRRTLRLVPLRARLHTKTYRPVWTFAQTNGENNNPRALQTSVM
eukprot:11216917-Lingulodinium_polyedra.AAC.1